MPKKKKRKTSKPKRRGEKDASAQVGKAPFPQESRGIEAITIAWAVSVSTTLLFNLLALLAYCLLWVSPEREMLRILYGLALGGGAMIATISLILLGVTLRIRETPPPQSLIAFAICITIAPILAVLLRISGLVPA